MGEYQDPTSRSMMGIRTPKGPWKALALPRAHSLTSLPPTVLAGWMLSPSARWVLPSGPVVWPEGLRDLAMGRGFWPHCEGEITPVGWRKSGCLPGIDSRGWGAPPGPRPEGQPSLGAGGGILPEPVPRFPLPPPPTSAPCTGCSLPPGDPDGLGNGAAGDSWGRVGVRVGGLSREQPVW